jgi:hypothetical protein
MPSSTRRLRPVIALVLGLSMLPLGSADASVATSSTPTPSVAAPAAAPGVVRPPAPRDVASSAGGGVGTVPRVSTTSRATDTVTRVAVALPAPKVKLESKTSSSHASVRAYRGRDRIWIPSLGIARSVSFFSCSSRAYPSDRVYRWGCAGRNNVYLFGHAGSVFKPLHDAYVRHRLRTGMRVVYADANGRVSTYAVRWWKVTTPDRGRFAYAAQSKPSLTLQTCVGSRSQYRLIVRLTKVG